MREIKFKLWNIDTKRWNRLQTYNVQDGEIKPRFEGEQVVCQYTGLKDKNGTPIYEGDIVDQLDLHQIGNRENPRKQTVIEFNPTSGYDIWPHDIEVIGNIYESPELLTKDKE